MKELLRIYLSRKLISHLFDHRTRIRTYAGLGIGVFRESFEFIDQSKAPLEIRRIRNRDRLAGMELDTPEQAG